MYELISMFGNSFQVGILVPDLNEMCYVMCNASGVWASKREKGEQ